MNRRGFLASLPLIPAAVMLSATSVGAVAVVDERPTFNRSDYVLVKVGSVGEMFDCRTCGARHESRGYYTKNCVHPAAFRRDYGPVGLGNQLEDIPDNAVPVGGKHDYCEIIGAHEHERPLVRWQ